MKCSARLASANLRVAEVPCQWAGFCQDCFMPEALPSGERIFRGIPVSAGVCRGKLLVLGLARPVIDKRPVSETAVAEEINRFEKALVQTRHQLLEVQRKVSD